MKYGNLRTPSRLDVSAALVMQVVLLQVALFSQLVVAQQPVELLHAWEVEPELQGTWIPDTSGVRPPLMPQRIESPLLQTCLDEAQRCVLLADDADVQGKQETLTAIMARLSNAPENLQARQALISAAVALSDGAEANALWTVAQADRGSRATVERALIQWRSPIALEAWRQRVDSSAVVSSDLLLALQGIAVAGDATDRQRLAGVLQQDNVPFAVRLAAARALGSVAVTGLEPLAEELVLRESNSVETGRGNGRLLAAELLQMHDSAQAKQVLLRILQGAASPAQRVAYRRLNELEPKAGRKLAKDLLDNPDSGLRLQAVRALSDGDDEFSLRTIGYALRDRNPSVRRTVRETLRRRASEPRDKAFVVEAVGYYLRSDFADAIEQAIVLSVELELESNCRQFVALLSHPDPRVNVRAAWALQELAHTPDILDASMPAALAVTMDLEESKRQVGQADISRTAFLFGAYGRNAYRPASDMLRKYVPKQDQKMNQQTRAAAIWALGSIFSDQENGELADALAERLLDNTPNNPEDPIVKYASAIALGRMRNPASPEQLTRTPEQIPMPVGYAAAWALEQFEQPVAE